MSVPTAHKRLGCCLALGQEGLVDASPCRPHLPRAIEPAKGLTLVELRRKWLIPGEKTPNAVQVLSNGHAYCANLGVRRQRLLTTTE
ncbi:hypothetical protein J2X09_002665 [Hydrogenophaga laconesensis]|uniref:Transposase n=2 Tax=Hydrogenophaga laconesensis TaxID=1805971 RepID=A0ABU1VBT7_9BURK|nr:hypothetical protein [Hydrogenophaga laconesensis]